MTMETKQLHALSKIYKEAVYGGAKKEAPKDTRMVVTAADKKANTPAYQKYKAGSKLYKAADHLKTEDAKYGYDKDGNSLNPKDKKAKKDYDGDGKVESGTDEYKGSVDKAIKKAMKKESYSDWRQDLKEIPDYDQIPVDSKKSGEKISEKNVKNTVKINPTMEEEFNTIEEYADTLNEADIADILARLEKKRISKGGDPDESPLGKKTGQAMKAQQDKQRKKAGLKTEDVEIEEGVYEKQKTKEVMGALKKRDLKKDVKKKIAADIVKRKGDTSKSDDRYAYEDNVWDKVADMLTELGKLNDVEFRVEGYQRNPEKGEKEDRKYEKVRGERTPMPPRGNKRREEFERWYAANVR